jgi:hypothetical protein
MGFAIALALLILGLDRQLPYMLLSHYKFPVGDNSGIFSKYGAQAEAITYSTSDGIPIKGWLIPTKTKSTSSTIIMLHTLGGTRQDLLEFALPLRQLGFNLLLIDLRGHGQSGGEFFTYGFHEWKDVSGGIDYLKGRGDIQADNLAVLGVSAGGAVAVAAAAHDDRIKALVAIAAFADLNQIIVEQTQLLPAWWRQRALKKAENLAQFTIQQASPVQSIRQVKCPILIVHGTQDDYIPYENAKTLLANATAKKQLFPILNATHATMLAKGGDSLRRAIAQFLQTAIEEKVT